MSMLKFTAVEGGPVAIRPAAIFAVKISHGRSTQERTLIISLTGQDVVVDESFDKVIAAIEGWEKIGSDV